MKKGKLWSMFFDRKKKKKKKKMKLKLNEKHPVSKAIIDRQKQLNKVMEQ